MRTCSLLLLAVVLRVTTPAAAAESAPAFPDQTERLMGLARVWAHVKFYHPYLAYKPIDWDAALVAAIPEVEAARDDAAYRAAVQRMLAVLRDPATRVVAAAAPPPPLLPGAAATPAEWLTWPANGIMLVETSGVLARPVDWSAVMVASARIRNEAARAKVMVIDLGTRPTDGESAPFFLSTITDVLPATGAWPSERLIQHNGFRTQAGVTSGDYFSTFISAGATPPRKPSAPGPKHVVFVIREGMGIPPIALALQAAGNATLVVAGKPSDVNAITTADVELPGGVGVKVRVTELEWGPIRADVTVAPRKDVRARALVVARTAAGKRPGARRRVKPVVLPPLVPRNDEDYAADPYPSRELRLLAGIRAWAVLDQFWPYRHLVDDWDGVLREMLPRLAVAPDAAAYRQVLREMAARAGDGHVDVYPADRTKEPPRALPPFVGRLVEGKLAVFEILDARAARELGLARGDVVETIDGRPVAELVAAERRITSGSTDDARDQAVVGRILAGADGSQAKLGVRGATGARRDVTITRTRAATLAHLEPAPAPAWKRLADRIGYVDLRRLTVPEVDPMFDALKDTRAIIFDLRGYPNSTAWAIAPRINTRKASHGALFLQPRRIGTNRGHGDERLYFLQALPTTDKPLYTGKIVVLIDDRAVSQSEHTCLFFQEAAGAVFVGSPTHGANGDVTVARLPGALRLSFTGQEVRHRDGKQLQKLGIQPHIPVRPTLAGLRAGKDEVLDRAIHLIKQGK